MEQLTKNCIRVAVTTTEQGEQRLSKSLMDHFSTSSSKYILETDILGTWDGGPLLGVWSTEKNAWRLKKKGVKPKIVECRTTKKYDKEHFQHDMQQMDWETILTPFAGNPSAMADTFQEIFESLLNVHAPIKRRRVRSEFAPCLTQNLRKSIDARDRLKKIAVKSPEIW